MLITSVSEADARLFKGQSNFLYFGFMYSWGRNMEKVEINNFEDLFQVLDGCVMKLK